MEDRELARRATAAWHKYAEDPDTLPVVQAAEVVDHDFLKYVVLSGQNELLAVYRVRNDGQLKRLKRIPSWADGGDAKKPEPHIYVIGSEADRHVKIGSAHNPEKYLVTMQAGSPHRLRVLLDEPGSEKVVTGLHQRFSPFRVADGWFDFGAANPVALVRAALKQIEVA
jgi:hypothetical protein